MRCQSEEARRRPRTIAQPRYGAANPQPFCYADRHLPYGSAPGASLTGSSFTSERSSLRGYLHEHSVRWIPQLAYCDRPGRRVRELAERCYREAA